MPRLAITLNAEKGKPLTAKLVLATAGNMLKLLKAVEASRMPGKHTPVPWQVDILNSPSTALLVFHADASDGVDSAYYETMAEATQRIKQAKDA